MTDQIMDALTFLGVVSFIANVVPGALEVALTVFIHKHGDHAFIGWLVATFFNAAGSTTILLLSSKIPHKKELSPRAEVMMHKYGALSLLFSGVPFVGDILPLAAGWFRLKILPCIICLFIGKGIRYGIIVLFLEYVTHQI